MACLREDESVSQAQSRKDVHPRERARGEGSPPPAMIAVAQLQQRKPDRHCCAGRDENEDGGEHVRPDAER
eukprot:CAMPEP_0170182134 /NCGR_PEP_ID=MMETSP0040_2-20121228/27016_1 /TAXON_ID=641309 /ORGANISM="Lotharella oceanica, Strain CCMP622" /LENGTH=70 /DNA_ID=CAMNT_0010427441 /DNA_START=630 /DNA_END=842 /DNA_ORIENTATION=+